MLRFRINSTARISFRVLLNARIGAFGHYAIDCLVISTTTGKGSVRLYVRRVYLPRPVPANDSKPPEFVFGRSKPGCPVVGRATIFRLSGFTKWPIPMSFSVSRYYFPARHRGNISNEIAFAMPIFREKIEFDRGK